MRLEEVKEEEGIALDLYCQSVQMERTIRGIHEMLRNGLKSIMNLKKEQSILDAVVPLS